MTQEFMLFFYNKHLLMVEYHIDFLKCLIKQNTQKQTKNPRMMFPFKLLSKHG